MNERIREWMARPGPMMDACRLMDLYHLLCQCVRGAVEGDVVELGAHEGQSAVLLRETLDYLGSGKGLHAYDSFLGLPPPGERDAGCRFSAGDLVADASTLRSRFDERGLEPPTVHAGWFDDTLPDELPPLIAFAHLDCDLYEPILTCLEAVYPRLASGAVVVVDDYEWEGAPGVRAAVDEFLASRPERICPMRVLPWHDAPHAYFMRGGS